MRNPLSCIDYMLDNVTISIEENRKFFEKDVF